MSFAYFLAKMLCTLYRAKSSSTSEATSQQAPFSGFNVAFDCLRFVPPRKRGPVDSKEEAAAAPFCCQQKKKSVCPRCLSPSPELCVLAKRKICKVSFFPPPPPFPSDCPPSLLFASSFYARAKEAVDVASDPLQGREWFSNKIEKTRTRCCALEITVENPPWAQWLREHIVF